VHDADEAKRAAEAALMIFGNVNFDLMYALPHQSVEGAQSDLAQALSFAPPHLSFYHLTLEPNTLFFKAPPPLPDEDTSADIEAAVHATLARAGYEHYETSAYARPDRQCRHNLNYWQFGDYLAVGAGAHGKYTDDGGKVWRYRKLAHPASYMKASETGQLELRMQLLAEADLLFEFMLNALRLKRGFTTGDFEARTGLSWSVAAPGVARAVSLGLMSGCNGSGGNAIFLPTGHGRRFLNDLQALFLPEPAFYSQSQA
jgi:oxygen-independent coproporphyrinogen-3 oxidase